MLLFEKNAPRWIVFFIDISICTASLILAYLLRFNFSIPEIETDRFSVVFPVALGVRALSFYLFKTYQGIVRYTSSKDAQRIFKVISAGSIFFIIANLLAVKFFKTEFYLLPFSVVIIDYMAVTFLMISLRLIYKSLYFELKNPGREKRSVIIFGSGEAGIITKRTLDRDAGTKYKTIAFIDDNKNKKGKILEGVKIEHASELENLLSENDVAHVIITVENLSSKRKDEIVEICLKHNTKILNLPPASSWIKGELSFRQIKKVQIEELLERKPIQLDEKNIQKQVTEKIILVTGAAGSIGSELVRQLLQYAPKKIILLDQAESPLYDLETELREKHTEEIYETVIGDISNYQRMENVFKTFQPQLVFHAAAYKHVPVMENNPSESIQTNILGTKIIADLANQYNVEKFILISTDKAVNPTGIMGASKRIAEIYIQSLNQISKTKYITTRFGNVLGSNGSVIPLFKKQIENGGPVTVTHPEITRYFMTISEACLLVLEAGAMGKGGEIFVFDMGKPVKIVELAKKMVQLSGMQIGKDIEIAFSGLRPGEKLYEELLNQKENTLPTHNVQILIAKVREYNYDEISKEIANLIGLFNSQDNFSIVAKMKQIVPEFISNNSIYETIDVNTGEV